MKEILLNIVSHRLNSSSYWFDH